MHWFWVLVIIFVDLCNLAVSPSLPFVEPCMCIGTHNMVVRNFRWYFQLYFCGFYHRVFGLTSKALLDWLGGVTEKVYFWGTHSISS